MTIKLAAGTGVAKGNLGTVEFPTKAQINKYVPWSGEVTNIGGTGVFGLGIVNVAENSGNFTLKVEGKELIVSPNKYVCYYFAEPKPNGTELLVEGEVKFSSIGTYTIRIWGMHLDLGKWYYEHRESTVRKSSVIGHLGLGGDDLTLDGNALGGSFSGFYWGSSGLLIAINGTNAGTGWVSSPGIGDGDILNIAYDADSRNIWFGINGTYYTVSGVTLNGNGNPTSGTNPTAPFL